MRDYAKVSPQFWIGSTGRRLRKGGQEAQIVAMYLLTCPSSSMIGMYYLPVATIAHDTGLSIEGACKGLARCIEAEFCSYDDESGVVWVHEMARYQIGDQLSASDKRCDGVQNDYDKMMENPFLSAFYERYHRAFNMKRRREYTVINTSPLEAPSKALRSQEQEQEQENEQEHEQEVRRTTTKNPGSDPEPKRDEPKRPNTLKRPDDVTEDTWQAFVALRKAKKAPLSGIALDRMRAEAGKAKITIDEAMQTCCLRGWTGFKAEWITEDRGGGQRINGNAAPSNSYVGLSQKDYGKTRMGGFLERVMSEEMKAKLNGGEK